MEAAEGKGDELRHLQQVHRAHCDCLGKEEATEKEPHTDAVLDGTQSNERLLSRLWSRREEEFIEVSRAKLASDPVAAFDAFLNRLFEQAKKTSALDDQTAGVVANSKSATVDPESSSSENNNVKMSSMDLYEELDDIQKFILDDMDKSDVSVPPNVESLATATTPPPPQPQPPPSSDCSSVFTLASSSSSETTPTTKPSPLSASASSLRHLSMAIDCTGVSGAFALSWRCKPCQEEVHSDKRQCRHYAPLHRPRHALDHAPDQPLALPPQLLLKEDGVYVGAQGLRAFTRLGPIVGHECAESDVDFDEDRNGVFLLFREDGIRRCILTNRNGVQRHWTHMVTASDSMSEANLRLISMSDSLYFVSTRSLCADTRLQFYANEDPATVFWTTCTQAWADRKRCTRCSRRAFNTVHDYRVHIALWHDLELNSKTANPQNRIYYCPDCNERQVGAKMAVAHCKSVHGRVPFECRHCGKRFETYNSLVKHKGRLHPSRPPTRRACSTCGKLYLDAKALRQHERQMHGPRWQRLYCPHCDVALSSKYALNRHVRDVHHRRQEHVCSECGKSFTQHSNLKQHMLIHLGVKPFVCAQQGCQSAFTTKQCLQVHYRKVHRFTDESMPEIRRQRVAEVDDHVRRHRAANVAATNVNANVNATNSNSNNGVTATNAAALYVESNTGRSESERAASSSDTSPIVRSKNTLNLSMGMYYYPNHVHPQQQQVAHPAHGSLVAPYMAGPQAAQPMGFDDRVYPMMANEETAMMMRYNNPTNHMMHNSYARKQLF